MGLDAMEDQARFDALRLRVERLEREMAALQRDRGRTASPQPAIPPPSAPILPNSTPLPPPFAAAPAAPPPRQSMENRIGSQWFSRIGISALLIATALFLKLAFDNHWIGPLGRTLAGLIGGAAMILWSERFRRSGIRPFAYALKAIGSGVLYLTLWAAFQLYSLMPSPVAFGAMLLVTAWNAYMAWSQDAELLAAYALIGGFATPALLSTGADHEVFLFSYILAIDIAAAALVRLKPWFRLIVAAFLPTVGFYATWYAFAIFARRPFALTTLFVSLFFLVFAAASTRALRNRSAETPSGNTIADILLPLANALFTAFALYALLNHANLTGWAPWVAVLLAAIYLLLVRISRSAVTAAVHLSLAILFLTLAIPLKATGRGIVIGWLVEGAALLWIAARLSQDRGTIHIRNVLRWLACGTLTLGFLCVLTAPAWLSLPLHAAPFLNERFLTGIIGAAAFACATWIGLRAHRDTHSSETVSPSWIEIAAVSVIAFNLLALWSVVQEINALWRHNLIDADASLQRNLATSGFLMAYGAVLLAAGFWKRTAFVRWQALILLVFTIGKTFVYDMSSLSQGYRVVSFLGLGALLMAVSYAYQKDWLSLREATPHDPGNDPTGAQP